MRIGINMPLKDADGNALTAQGVARRAQMIEAAGFNSIWLGDSIGGATRPDPLMWLLVAAAATERVEVGTAILQIPLRHPVELAQRFLTLHTLTQGRFTVGAGAGSTRSNLEAAGVDYSQRFKILARNLSIIRRLCNGEEVGPANLRPWPNALGGPPIVIGSWGSEVWLRRAAQEYDGWMSSGGRSNFRTMTEGIKRFRDLGGRRAIAASVAIDLDAPTKPVDDDAPPFPAGQGFNLQCQPDAAVERIQRVAGLGYDDLLLVKYDHLSSRSRYEVDFTEAGLAAIRDVLKAAGQ